MANSYIDQADQAHASRYLKAWVAGVALAALLALAGGLWLAALVSGVARPWDGIGFAVAVFLALVVGLSKTSSN